MTSQTYIMRDQIRMEKPAQPRLRRLLETVAFVAALAAYLTALALMA
jgi:hypothetical protein